MNSNSINQMRFLSKQASLALYLKEIGNTRTLSPKEEAECAARIRKGDPKALDRLVRANLRFVVSVARNYQNQGLPLNDLINEGNYGLIKAAKRFDENKNFKFISYAVWWIRQAILQALAEQSRIMKLPLNQAGIMYKIGKAQSRFEQAHSRLPGTDEIAHELGVQKEKIDTVIRVGNNHRSLDAPLRHEESGKLLDLLEDPSESSPDDAVMQTSLQKEVARILGLLNGKEREIIRHYFGIGDGARLTLEDIAIRFNLTRERVRQIKEHALKRLKQITKTELFQD